jgi:hypothetical protein
MTSPPAPPFALEPWEVTLFLRLREMRKNGIKLALVHLDDVPGVRPIGSREKLVDILPETEYPRVNLDKP